VLSVPGLKLLPEGPANDQVTPVLKLPVPATVAVNWTCVPMVAVAGLGVTVTDVMAGPVDVVKLAVTVALAFITTVQVTVLAVVHPDHEVKVLLPELEGAVSVTVVPAL
jgi:hypothetical protein